MPLCDRKYSICTRRGRKNWLLYTLDYSDSSQMIQSIWRLKVSPASGTETGRPSFVRLEHVAVAFAPASN